MEGFRPFMLAVDEPVYVSAKVDLSHARHCRRIVKIRDFGDTLFGSSSQLLDWDATNQQWQVFRNDETATSTDGSECSNRIASPHNVSAALTYSHTSSLFLHSNHQIKSIRHLTSTIKITFLGTISKSLESILIYFWKNERIRVYTCIQHKYLYLCAVGLE